MAYCVPNRFVHMSTWRGGGTSPLPPPLGYILRSRLQKYAFDANKSLAGVALKPAMTSEIVSDVIVDLQISDCANHWGHDVVRKKKWR